MDVVLIEPGATPHSEVAYLSALSAVVRPQVATPTSPVIKARAGAAHADIMPWGENNLYPQEILELARRSTILAPGLDIKARALYQGGLVYGYTDLVEGPDGYKEKFTPAIIPDVENFRKRSNLNRYLLESIVDFYYFYNPFPELIVSKDRRQILAITEQESVYSRWGKQNEKTGLVDTCYINANWGTVKDVNDPLVTKVPVIDPYYDPVAALRDDRQGFKYIYPISYPTPGNSFYQLVHWDAVRTSGWLDVAQAIPAFKKALFANQVTIKYLIEVATWWWEWKYPDFPKKTPAQKTELQNLELKKFQDFMAGAENTGNSLMVTFHSNPQLQKEYPGWKITAIDNKIRDGIYIEDSQEASSHLLFALSVDPAMMGAMPGKGMGAGSGSDKQAAFNQYISLCQVHADIIFEPLNFIRDYNLWDPRLTFKFKREILAPQTSGKPQLEKV